MTAPKPVTTADAREIADKVDDIFARAAIRSLADQLDVANASQQYWMHSALGRETEGDDRDAELLRMAAGQALRRLQQSLTGRGESVR